MEDSMEHIMEHSMEDRQLPPDLLQALLIHYEETLNNYGTFQYGWRERIETDTHYIDIEYSNFIPPIYNGKPAYGYHPLTIRISVK